MMFSDLNLSKPLLNALADQELTTPTGIQDKAFSIIMSGRDVVGIAQTGTGKTLAYLLPCLRLWKFSGSGMPQIVIVVPTRELVVQVVDEVKKLTTYMNVVTVGVYGGANIKTQLESINNGVDVLVATPGRLIDLKLTGILRFKAVKRVIIDEVDEMLNLGFRVQLTTILDMFPPKRQNLLFSATITTDVEDFIKTFCVNHQTIKDTPTGTPLDNINQIGYELPNYNTKVNLLKLMLADASVYKKVLVFTASKNYANVLFDAIEKDFPEQVGVIHSNKSQNNRFNSVKQFHAGDCRILIATDLLARGIDISEITHVINFSVPEIPENYIHRIGRTGRADKTGIAVTLITPAEAEQLVNIETLMNHRISLQELPSDLEISDVLTDDEIPKIVMKIPFVKIANKENKGKAFHEKLDKNKKVNNKIRRTEKMRLKYGKPQSRGQKPPR